MVSWAHMDEGTPGTSNIIALFGATGFIGFELQRSLLADGFGVRALIRPNTTNRHRVVNGVDVREVTLSDRAGIESAVCDVDVIIYSAGTVRGCGVADFREANVDGLRLICDVASKQTGPPLVILISSLAATRPELSHYAHSKHEGERVLQACNRLAWTILRPPAVYGPGDREMLPVFRLIRRGIALLVGPSQQRLSLLHVEDLARAVSTCLRRPNVCRGQIFEIDDGHDGGYDWNEIVALSKGRRPVTTVRVPRSLLSILSYINLLIARCLRRAPMLTPGKSRELSQETWLCDNTAFTSATGWRPVIQLGEGVQRLFSVTG